MALQWIAGIVFALWVSPLAWSGSDEPDPHPRLGGGVPRRRHQRRSRSRWRSCIPARAIDALHDRHRADADGRAAHPPHRRPHRDALPRLRIAGVPGVLSRLARAASRRPSSSPPITCCAASSGRSRSTASLVAERVALGRACGLGRVRGRLPGDVVPARHARAAARSPTRTAALEQAHKDQARHAIEQTRAGGAPAADAAGGRGGHARQERVRGQHEPRAADAAERDHALQRAAAGGRRQTTAARATSADLAKIQTAQQAPARPDQRHPRSVEDRGRQDGARARDLRRRARWSRS